MGAFDTACTGLEASEAISTLGLSIAYNYVIDKSIETAAPIVAPVVIQAGEQVIIGTKHAIEGSKRVTEAFTIAGELGAKITTEPTKTLGIPEIGRMLP